MKKFSYLEILFTGLVENANDIKEFTIRHQKLAERDNFITSESFYLNMSTEVSNLKSEIENIFYNRQNDLNKALDRRKANNGNIKVIEDQLNSMKLDDFGLNILRLSEGTFKGHLRYSELQYLEGIVKEASTNMVQKKQQKEIKKPKKILNDYFINIKEDKKEEFYKELKKTFPTEIGKSIKAIIDKLISEDLLSIGAREYNKFIIELAQMFKRDIGKYQGIQNVKQIDKETKEPIEQKLKPLINKYKTN